MKRARKFFALPSTHQRLLVTAVLLLGVIRLGLWLLRFQTLQRLLRKMARISAGLRQAQVVSVDNVLWAVTVASRFVPQATCLTQALAGQVLLVRRGHLAHLCIGVARSQTGQFQAHAWVEYQGRVVLGGADAPLRFTLLPPLKGSNLRPRRS